VSGSVPRVRNTYTRTKRSCPRAMFLSVEIVLLQLDSMDESIEGWEPATHDELHQVKYPPDLEKMVQEATNEKTSDGIDLQKDIQPYATGSDAVCELASETAEWWGPEWNSDEDDPRLDSMTPVWTIALVPLPAG
jgi:hypothetical protein